MYQICKFQDFTGTLEGSHFDATIDATVSSPLRSRLTPTMRLEVKRVGCSKPHQLVLSIDTSVRQLKEQLPETLTLGTAPNVFHLIYGGTVLCDDSRLGELALVDQPTLWLLRGLEASSQIRKAAELAVSLGVFPLGIGPPYSLQRNLSKDGALLLRSFADSFASEAGHWRPSESETNSFRDVVGALESKGPAFQAAPHVTWFGAFGCALLANEPRAGAVHLTLVCLDQWAFRMHSGPEAREHTADAMSDSSSVDTVGQVPSAEYPEFLCVRGDRTRKQRDAGELR